MSIMKPITAGPEFRAWRDVARARDAERREAVSKIYWLRIHLRLLAAVLAVYFMALVELDGGIAWGMFVFTFGAWVVTLAIGAWASPRKPS